MMPESRPQDKMLPMVTSFFMLLLAGAPASAAPVHSTQPAVAAAAQDKPAPKNPLQAELESLMSEYRAAMKAWSKARQENPKAPRPVPQFWDRYSALAEKGSPDSLLWMAQNAAYQFEGRKKEITAKKLECYEKLITGHPRFESADELPRMITNEKKYFERGDMDRLLSLLLLKSESRDVQAACLESLTRILADTSATEADKKRAEEYKLRLEKEFEGTLIVDRMRAAEFKKNNLQVGMVAPDFTHRDVEGVEFKLSDYRGKVVLLDFWGFW